jgi:hypothetical protein
MSCHAQGYFEHPLVFASYIAAQFEILLRRQVSRNSMGMDKRGPRWASYNRELDGHPVEAHLALVYWIPTPRMKRRNEQDNPQRKMDENRRGDSH